MVSTHDLRTQNRSQTTYHTRANTWRKVRTPGNRLTTLKVDSKPLATKCAMTGKRLEGIKRVDAHKLTSNQRTVSRAYGGKYSHDVVREKILRAVLFSESRLAKKSQKK